MCVYPSAQEVKEEISHNHHRDLMFYMRERNHTT